MEYVPTSFHGHVAMSIHRRRACYSAFIYCIIALVVSSYHTSNAEPANSVSIEEFIDLDGGAPFHAVSEGTGRDVNIKLGQGHIVQASWAKEKGIDVLFDDEEFLTSGSGSGSGDDDLTPVFNDANGQFTPTRMTSTVPAVSVDNATSEETSTEGMQKDLTTHKHIGLDHTFLDSDTDDNNDIVEEDADSIYDLPGSSPVTSNHIINPAAWAQWSDWFVAGTSSKVRVRICQVDGEEVSEVACEGVRVQMKSCDNAGTGRCGKVQNITSLALGGCPDRVVASKDVFLKAPSPPPAAPKTKPPVEEKPDPDVCQYSLFDNYRQKYVFTRWNLTELITKSKVKRWCDRNSGQYLVMTTPKEHCRRYYKDLCKVSEKCRSDKPAKERGDFAEGCWRNLVYGEMLPIGVSKKETISYFICQRFAAQSQAGKIFGPKQTHFGTLYDTSMRAPVLSLAKVTQLGDETWPETDYFIEHGLVENESDMLWLFRKPRKGMLTLHDLDRCQEDQSCDLGLRQVLPHDYHDPRDTGYVPTHLMWPDLMPSDPGPRLATFTMTNMAPMHHTLIQEWHDTIRKVRQFAIQECGVPVILDSSLRHLGEFTNHRANKSAMFVASGLMPSMDPAVTTGHDVRVPFLFWLSGCCVKQHTVYSSSNDNDYNNNNSSNASSYSDKDPIWNEADNAVEITNISAFALYIRNVPDSHVIPAPVLQLEMLLQDIYKAMPTDPDVSLFPGQDSACSDLKNDVSQWFQ